MWHTDTYVTHIDTYVTHIDIYVTHIDIYVTHIDMYVTHIDIHVTHLSVYVTHIDIYVTRPSFSAFTYIWHTSYSRRDAVGVFHFCFPEWPALAHSQVRLEYESCQCVAVCCNLLQSVAACCMPTHIHKLSLTSLSYPQVDENTI